MNTWKRNAVIATVLLFVCAGIYLNWSHQQKALNTDLTDTLPVDALMQQSYEQTLMDTAEEDLAVSSMEDSFASIRLSRQQSRESAIELLQETISYASDEQTAEAGTAKMQLEQMVQSALMEAQIESMVIAKGYADCVVYFSEDLVSVAVAAPQEGLKDADVAVLADLVTSQTDYDVSSIRIIEVS